MDDTLTSLIECVKENDFLKLELLLLHRSRKLLFSIVELGKVLKIAADKGHVKCVQILLDGGAPVNAHDENGFTPLIMAASNGHSAIIKLLLQSGASPDKATFRLQATALHWAATHGHLECVQLLVKAGASLVVQTVSGRTPLMLAARSDHRDIVQYLVDAGSDINLVDNENATVLHLVADEGCVRCARILLPLCADIDAKMKNGDTPLVRAVKRGQTEMVKLLTRWSCDQGNESGGLTAIHWAAERGHAECVEILLHAGANPNSATSLSYDNGVTLFMRGVTPLMLAAKNGHEMALQALIKTGAEIDAVDQEGRTPLLYSVKHNHPRCLVALVVAGADPDGVLISDSTEQKQVGSLYGQYANNDDNSDSTDDDDDDDDDGTDDSDDDDNNPANNEANNYDRNQLLDLNTDESDGDDGDTNQGSEPLNKTRGVSPLFLAIKENHKDCVKALLRCGCSLDVLAEANDQYVGPFEYALVAGYVSTAKMLLTCGLTKNNMNPMLLTMAFDLLLTTDDSDSTGGSRHPPLGADSTPSDGAELVDWVLDQIKAPPSLMILSRKVIRDSMGRRAIGAVPELHLPKSLENYVALKDLDDF